MIVDLGLYLAFGCLAGILSGLFGIGGGVVIVPFLVGIFGQRGFPPDLIMIMAVATSLATIVVTSISAAYAHHRRGAVDWPTVWRLAPGILIGAVLGSVIADDLPTRWFKLIFASFLLYVAVRLLSESRNETPPAPLTSPWLFRLAGPLIGALSSILGIGGGTLSVPFLVRYGHGPRQAVAISSACGFPIALAGTTTYIALGWMKPGLPEWSTGYVYLPAFAAIILTSIPFAPLGATLAHRWPTRRLKTGLAIVVAIVGGKLLWQALTHV